MKRGFTLIELLVVIAILAVLATAVVLVLNPGELIKQARDSTRIADLGAINSALSLVLTDVSGLSWSSNGTSTCTVTGSGTSTSPIASTTTGYTASVCANRGDFQNNSGTGWVPIDFTQVTGGAPISKLPLDPVNNLASTACASTGGGGPAGCFYAYKASSTQGIYEIDANMESIKYSNSGTSDVESKDGGNNGGWYEVGSSLVL